MSPSPPTYTKPTEALAAVIRSEQAVRDWSLADLADAANISAPTLRRYRTGERTISVDHLYAFAVAFGMTSAQLVELMNSRLEPQESR